MNTARRLLPLLACLIATAVLAASAGNLPKTNTRDAIKSYVVSAATIVRKSGPSCATFSSPEWRGGDYYIFVLGPDGALICHPTAAMIGKPASTIVNAERVKVGEMVAAKGKGTGSGWLEYQWPQPGQTVEQPKSTYVIGVTGPDGKHYVVGSGGWNVKE
ncbi:MAG TPA: cache domain-containing protein [Thermoanaerobaculia bacterium]|jgi:cytochrome c|nr:cache domain-containing protein [Thermoanaerobaculia bacterium]